MLIALTHVVSPQITTCELTFIDRQPIDLELARQQHDEYCAALENCGIKVRKLDVNLSYPDSCFIEDTAVVLDELAVIANMGAVSRRGETKTIGETIAEYRSEVVYLAAGATLEGGDVLRIGRTVFVGVSRRTTAEGFDQLGGILRPRGYEVVPVEVRGSLHLKSACTALDDETLLVNPQWVELDPFRRFNLLFTPADESWAANALRMGNTLFLQSGFPKTLELVGKLGYKVKTLDTSEFRKAEGSLTCLSIVFDTSVGPPTE